MKKLKELKHRIISRGPAAVVLSAVLSTMLVTGLVSAATTISTSITTGGTLSVTGLSSLLGGATTTSITLLNGEVISNATDGVVQLNGIASSTSITLLNGETITNATDGIIQIGTASATTTLPGGVNLETGTGSVATNAVTISKVTGVITDATNITATTTRAAITLNNTRIVETSVVLVSVCSALDAGASLAVSALPASGLATLTVSNVGYANQTSDYKICFMVAN